MAYIADKALLFYSYCTDNCTEVSMAKQTERIEIRVTADELKILDAYCQIVDLNRTEVLREYIQSLKKKFKKMSSEV
jgi:hypothetical protein